MSIRPLNTNCVATDFAFVVVATTLRTAAVVGHRLTAALRTGNRSIFVDLRMNKIGRLHFIHRLGSFVIHPVVPSGSRTRSGPGVVHTLKIASPIATLGGIGTGLAGGEVGRFQ